MPSSSDLYLASLNSGLSLGFVVGGDLGRSFLSLSFGETLNKCDWRCLNDNRALRIFVDFFLLVDAWLRRRPMVDLFLCLIMPRWQIFHVLGLYHGRGRLLDTHFLKGSFKLCRNTCDATLAGAVLKVEY